MYSVSINNTWTNDGKATKSFFELKGCIVNKSRLEGDYDVFISGRKVAIIFNEKKDQIKYLRDNGLI